MLTVAEQLELEEREKIEALRNFHRSELRRERRRRIWNELLAYLIFGALGVWVIWALARGL